MKTKKGEKEKLRITILEKAIAYFKVHGTGGAGDRRSHEARRPDYRCAVQSLRVKG